MSRNVLLVEDEPDLLLVARLMLEDSGYAVIEASGGEEAVELAEKAKVDAVFLGRPGCHQLRQAKGAAFRFLKASLMGREGLEPSALRFAGCLPALTPVLRFRC
jgi:DNA-binding NarL/FixJ family response regulator